MKFSVTFVDRYQSMEVEAESMEAAEATAWEMYEKAMTLGELVSTDVEVAA